MNIESIKNKSRLGFTLVELIVVIAILAILAGVAIPVYSNYIRKATEAKDLQLLAAANTAFAAACLEHGVDAKTDIASATLDGGYGMTLTLVDVQVKSTSLAKVISAERGEGDIALLGSHGTDLAATAAEAKTKIINSFTNTYFKGNENTVLQFFESITFNPATGAFEGVDPTGNAQGPGVATLVGEPVHDEVNHTTTYTFELSNGTEASYTVADEDVEAFNDSNFGSMGIAALTSSMGLMTSTATDVLRGNTEDSATYKIIAGALGSDWIAANLQTNEDGTYNTSDLTNAVVLAIGKSTDGFAESVVAEVMSQTGMSREQAQAYIDNNLGGTTQVMANKLVEIASSDSRRTNVIQLAKSGDANQMANIAMCFGMLTSYVNSSASDGQTVTTENGEVSVKDYFNSMIEDLGSANGGTQAVTKLMDATGLITSDTNFSSYMTNASQGVNDLDGYLAAMSAITDNNGVLSGVNDVISNGYNSAEVRSILNQLFNGSN